MVAAAVEVADHRGRVGGEDDAVAGEELADQGAVRVVGVAGGEPDRPAEPRQRDGHVRGAASGVLGDGPVGRLDDVDQGLAHHQHVTIHRSGLSLGVAEMDQFTVDPADSRPPYEQLRIQIASRIASGRMPPGTRLPTVRALAGELGLAVNTVAKTYRALETDGTVVTEGRRGTFVPLGQRQAAARRPTRPGEYVAVARRLGLGLSEATALVERTW